MFEDVDWVGRSTVSLEGIRGRVIERDGMGLTSMASDEADFRLVIDSHVLQVDVRLLMRCVEQRKTAFDRLDIRMKAVTHPTLSF